MEISACYIFIKNINFMKRIILLVVILVSVQITNAQFAVGLRAGLNSTAVQVDEIIQSSTGIDEYKLSAGEANVGFHFGAMARVGIISFYVQPEFLFSSTSSGVKVEDLISGVVSIQNQSFKKIDIPILFGKKFGLDVFAVRVQAGPVASILLSGESVFDNISNVQPMDELEKATWGFQAGVGVDLFEKIGLDVKYESGLSGLGDGVTIAGINTTFDSRTSQWIASVAYYF